MTPESWIRQPEILKLQILRIGQLVVLCVPGEVSTMAGRRLRAAIKAAVKDHWGNVTVEISGITNDYSSYITTYEEYQIQRYEGASTLFGPHTLEAYIQVEPHLMQWIKLCLQEFVKLAKDMVNDVHSKSVIQPPDYVEDLWSFTFPVELDTAPPGSELGGVRSDRSKDCYSFGETVEVEFWYAVPQLESKQFFSSGQGIHATVCGSKIIPS